MHFFDTYIGMYLLQSVVHSFVTLLMIEMSLRIWGVETPEDRFRYRLQVLILPLLMYPVFQVMNPERGSFYFIQDQAVFSSMSWLNFSIFDTLPLGYLFLFLVSAVSVLVLLQEIVPIAKGMLEKSKDFSGRPAGPEIENIVVEMSRVVKIERPSIIVVDEEYPLIYTTGTNKYSIIVSEGLLEIFDQRQLRSAMAHEIAHILRRSTVTTLLAFVVRICMFYNPVSLLEFRRLVQDDEHICDDITVSITGDPEGLASALRVFCCNVQHDNAFVFSDLKESIENSSHDLLLLERIDRLENGGPVGDFYSGWGRYVLTVVAVVVINYFVV